MLAARCLLITLVLAWGAVAQNPQQDTDQKTSPTTQVYAPVGTPQTRNYRYTPATGQDRLRWFLINTAGPTSLSAGVVSAAWGTLFNSPREYGPHWEGFAERYGMRLTGVSTSNAMEASLSSIWGEDPRYFREPDRSFGHRVFHVVKLTVLARNPDGREMPAYARYMAISGSSFLSNTWRADSEATTNKAIARIGLGFLGRMSSNAWFEFWPDVKQRVFHRQGPEHDPLSRFRTKPPGEAEGVHNSR